jgi:hypothetical protein
MPELNTTEAARLAELTKVPAASRTPAQKQEIATLEAKQNS